MGNKYVKRNDLKFNYVSLQVYVLHIYVLWFLDLFGSSSLRWAQGTMEFVV